MRTISIITDIKASGEIANGIEQTYDAFKNAIHSDHTYMRDDYQLQRWIFVNFVALMMHYHIYAILKSKDIQKKHSPLDVLLHPDSMAS